MSERKALTKYYPPEFDPSRLTKRRKQRKDAKLPTVTLMAPFTMRCTRCGTYIYKRRKFNARKETTDETYYAIPIYRFYIRCTSCSGEIALKTDPKHTGYECENGAVRVWHESSCTNGNGEEEREGIELEGPHKDIMGGMEARAMEVKTEVAVADALDEIRMRNARRDRTLIRGKRRMEGAQPALQEEMGSDDEAAVRKAFNSQGWEHLGRVSLDVVLAEHSETPASAFQRSRTVKKDYGAVLGLRRK